MHTSRQVLDQIMQRANLHKVIAIGEIHGSKENPEILLEVYSALSNEFSILIGFEYPQAVIDNPDTVDGILFQDGRFSENHQEMLKKLKQEGAQLFGFDLNEDELKEQKSHPIDWRDKIMADNINKRLDRLKDGKRILIITGDMHYQTKAQSIVYPNENGEMKQMEYLPMGAQINTNSILAIHLRYLSGEFYNFKLRQMPKITANKDLSFRQQDELIEIDIFKSNPTLINMNVAGSSIKQ